MDSCPFGGVVATVWTVSEARKSARSQGKGRRARAGTSAAIPPAVAANQLPTPKEIVMRFTAVTSFLSLLIGSSAFAQTVEAPAAPGSAATPAGRTDGGGGARARHARQPRVRPAADRDRRSAERAHADQRLVRGADLHHFQLRRVARLQPWHPGRDLLNRRVAVGIAAHAVGNDDSYFYDTPVRNVGTLRRPPVPVRPAVQQPGAATFESTLGRGRWCVEISEERDGCAGRNFLVFEPVANLELNVAKHVRVATGVGYRFAVAGNGPGPNSGDMSSPVARASIIFGASSRSAPQARCATIVFSGSRYPALRAGSASCG